MPIRANELHHLLLLLCTPAHICTTVVPETHDQEVTNVLLLSDVGEKLCCKQNTHTWRWSNLVLQLQLKNLNSAEKANKTFF